MAGAVASGIVAAPSKSTSTAEAIATVAVERGDAVRRGEVVATLRREVERANLSAASSRSEVQAELRAARAAAELARSKLVRAEDLRRQNFISEVAVEQARSEAEVAYRRVDEIGRAHV